MTNRGRGGETLPGGSPGPPSGARLRGRARRRAPGGRVCHGARPGSARRSNVAPPSPSFGPTIHRKIRRGRVRCHMGGSEGQGPRRTRPGQQRLALGTWNVTSLWGKEPELVREMERYQLDLMGLTSTHSLSSGTVLLDRGWTLFFSGVAQGVRHKETWENTGGSGQGMMIPASRRESNTGSLTLFLRFVGWAHPPVLSSPGFPHGVLPVLPCLLSSSAPVFPGSLVPVSPASTSPYTPSLTLQ
ncbi:uncharacterized protein LOC123974779 [Micropterus dolomieu]|uniref:uncharacterized protein LOC123974779 n=1 Tax=Micropterus dolomieu TaxID=147949 RepID=UPI001E8CD899|nr:uncharacterized protein LOC123974779 [Micropterus dolomieu]